MTDSNKLDLIVEKIMQIDIRTATAEKKSGELEVTVAGFDKRLKDLKRQQMRDTAELKAMDNMIFDEVERVHEILVKRTEALEKKIG